MPTKKLVRIVNPTRLFGGEWGVWIHGWNAKKGETVRVRTQSGKEWLAKLTEQAEPHKWRTEEIPDTVSYTPAEIDGAMDNMDILN